MADWSITIKPGPCEQFRAVGQLEVANTLPVEEQQRANAAVAQAEQVVFLAMIGQQATQYAAKITRKVKDGTETLTIALSASPVPALD